MREGDVEAVEQLKDLVQRCRDKRVRIEMERPVERRLRDCRDAIEKRHREALIGSTSSPGNGEVTSRSVISA